MTSYDFNDFLNWCYQCIEKVTGVEAMNGGGLSRRIYIYIYIYMCELRAVIESCSSSRPSTGADDSSSPVMECVAICNRA